MSQRRRWRLALGVVVLLALAPNCSGDCTDDVDPTNPNSCSYGQYPESTPAPALEGLVIATEVRNEERGVYEMEVSFENESDRSLELPECILHPSRNRQAPLRWVDDAPVKAGEDVTRTGIVSFGKSVPTLKRAYFGCEGGLVRADPHG